MRNWLYHKINSKAGILLFFLLSSLIARSQYFSTGDDPSALKWRQINTENFQLIYPEEFEEKAQLLASYFEMVYNYGTNTLKHKPRKISVIFHTRTVRSNGLVGWAPRRVELFTPPHQEIYAQDWLEQLVIHEFRHVVQVDKIYSEMPGIVKALMGEQGAALITGLYLPFWWVEGDAVAMETALGNTGRGRLPSFLMEIRTRAVEKGIDSFSKAYNGSFREFIPDHYKLGYFLVGETRARYGPGVWEKTVNRIAKKPLSVQPFQTSLKRETGLTKNQLYRSLMDSLRWVWLEEDKKYKQMPIEILTDTKRSYVGYTYNHYLESGDIISLKKTLDQVPRIVKIDSNGKEVVIHTPGPIFEESMGYRNNLVAWSEFVPDIRWTHSGKSLIRILNMETQKLVSFKPDYKCFAPTISPDEHNVAVVEADFENRYYLSLYNATDGALMKRYPVPGNQYIFNPIWKDDNELFLVVLTKEGKRLASIRPFEEKMEMITETDLGELKHLVYADNQLYFISSHTGKNELFSIDLISKEIRREVEARFGIEYPAFSADGKSLVLSDYTSQGFRLIRVNREDIHSVPVENTAKAVYKLAEKLASQERGVVDFSLADTTRRTSVPYRKGLHLFKFHSWAPLSLDLQSYEVSPGVSFASQNVLGTSVTSLGYKWNSTEKQGQYYLKYDFTGWFPKFSVEASTGKRASTYWEIKQYFNQQGEIVRRDTTEKPYDWKESKIQVGMLLPFNLTKGRYYRLLQPEMKYELTEYTHTASTPPNAAKGSIQSMAWRIYFHQLMRQAEQNLQPRWGLAADAGLRHSPFGGHSMGNLKHFQVWSYIPGLLPNHSITGWYAYQEKERGDYSFNDVIRYPTGWHAVNNRQLMSLMAGYALPLAYPDLSIGRLLYVKRIRSGFYYEFARANANIVEQGIVTGNYIKNMTSYRIDLIADTHFLLFYAPVTIGARFSHMPEIKENNFELLLSVDFNSL